MSRWIGSGIGTLMLITVLVLAFVHTCVGSAQSHVLAVVLALGAALLLWGVVGGLQIDVKLKFKALGEVTAAGVAAIFLVVHFVSTDGIIASEGCSQVIHGRVLLGDSETRGVASAVIKVDPAQGFAPDVNADANGNFTVVLQGPSRWVRIWAEKRGFRDSEVKQIDLPFGGDKLFIALRPADGSVAVDSGGGGMGSGASPPPDDENDPPDSGSVPPPDKETVPEVRGPTHVFNGRVVDGVLTGVGVASADIDTRAPIPNDSFVTDSRGYFSVSMPTSVTQFDLTVSKRGYFSMDRTVQLPLSNSEGIVFRLTAPREPVAGTCNVLLRHLGPNKISVIKAMRELSPGLGLAEAKARVDNIPSYLETKTPPAVAERYKAALYKEGAKVEVNCR